MLYKIGSCGICNRTNHQLDYESELCPKCNSDIPAARIHRKKFMRSVWKLRFVVAIIAFGMCYILARILPG